MGKLSKYNDHFMGKKVGRNDKCPCGSGKKYKKCCLGVVDSPLGRHQLSKKISSRELPFRAESISSNGAASSMKVLNAKVIQDGLETVLFDDEITLSTNTIDGDKTQDSSARIIIPTNDHSPPEISTTGNASVVNSSHDGSSESPYYDIAIQDNPKRGLKIKGSDGLFATVKIAKQRNKGFSYFDVYFGVKGAKEVVGADGQKNRPHIAFYPEGNGKFIRLSGYDCEIVNVLNYDPKEKEIYPSQIEIIISSHAKKIVMNFELNSESNLVTLLGGEFLDI